MASTASANETSNVTTIGEMLPIDPFRSLYVHFGMLLGVEDFRTVDAYHRGKMWLHNAWLHRQGTLWGLAVSLDAESNEVRVSAGAAVDELGRELYLQQDACLNLNAWFEEHKNDPELEDYLNSDSKSQVFTAHVIIQFKACLNRQVPALTEPCDGSNATTAYSRVAETVELKLVPGPAPDWRGQGQLPFHRVRVLFGLEEAMVDDEGFVTDSDQDVLDAKQDILDLPNEEQPAAYLDALRRFSALDQMEITPATVDGGDDYSLFPGVDPAAIALANLNDITLVESSRGYELDEETVTDNRVDNTIRPVHIPTSTQQELLCGPLMSAASAAPVPSSSSVPAPVDAGGPRVVAKSVETDGEFISFAVEGNPLMKASVDARAFSVTSFDRRDGWITGEINAVYYDEPSKKVVVELRDSPGGNLLRLIVRGTGPYPIMGRNRVPLAGIVDDGQAGTEFDGNDAVVMLRIKTTS